VQCRGFSYNPKFQCFVFDGTHRMSGAINLTSNWYYKDYDFGTSHKTGRKAVRQANTQVHPDSVGPPPPADRPNKKRANRSTAAAIKLGHRVDRELKWWAEHQAVPPKPHKYTSNIVKLFRRQQWKPISSQQIVGAVDFRVAHKYDLLMETREKERILVEIKTGGETYFDYSGGQKLSAPLDRVPSSRKTHAFLEVLFGKILYRLMYPFEPRIKDVCVVRAHSKGVDQYFGGDWLDQAEADMKKRIQERCNRG